MLRVVGATSKAHFFLAAKSIGEAKATAARVELMASTLQLP